MVGVSETFPVVVGECDPEMVGDAAVVGEAIAGVGEGIVVGCVPCAEPVETAEVGVRVEVVEFLEDNKYAPPAAKTIRSIKTEIIIRALLEDSDGGGVGATGSWFIITSGDSFSMSCISYLKTLWFGRCRFARGECLSGITIQKEILKWPVEYKLNS